MKKLLCSAIILMALAASPAKAEENCTAAIAKIDAAITGVKASDETKMKVLELREQAMKQQASGDEKGCLETARAATMLLEK